MKCCGFCKHYTGSDNSAFCNKRKEWVCSFSVCDDYVKNERFTINENNNGEACS